MPFDGHPLAAWIRSYRTLEELDFDVLSGGHGWKTFTRQDITDGRRYFEYLRSEVSSAMQKGMGLEEIKKNVTLSRYRDWANYERLRDVRRGTRRYLRCIGAVAPGGGAVARRSLPSVLACAPTHFSDLLAWLLFSVRASRGACLAFSHSD